MVITARDFFLLVQSRAPTTRLATKAIAWSRDDNYNYAHYNEEGDDDDEEDIGDNDDDNNDDDDDSLQWLPQQLVPQSFQPTPPHQDYCATSIKNQDEDWDCHILIRHVY